MLDEESLTDLSPLRPYPQPLRGSVLSCPALVVTPPTALDPPSASALMTRPSHRWNEVAPLPA